MTFFGSNGPWGCDFRRGPFVLFLCERDSVYCNPYLMKPAPISLGSLTVASDAPAVIIAELACEHRGDMEAAKALIRAAKEAGADIAKFQLHIPEEEMVGEHELMKFWAGSMQEILDEVNFETAEEHAELKRYCDQVGIQYLCTPFCIGASDVLETVGVDGYKTGSGELTNLPMLRHIAKKGKPIIVSTGMSTIDEIDDVVAVLKEEKVPFVLTHCLSEYPASYEHMNLGLIRTYAARYGCHVGWSDHATDWNGVLAAVALGARVIEKHMTIRSLHGPDDLVSLDPAQFADMVKAVRAVERALGDTRSVSEKEEEVRRWAHHSVVAARPIKAGEVFSRENLVPKRPGAGIPASYLDARYDGKLLGKRAARDLSKDTLLTWEDVALDSHSRG